MQIFLSVVARSKRQSNLFYHPKPTKSSWTPKGTPRSCRELFCHCERSEAICLSDPKTSSKSWFLGASAYNKTNIESSNFWYCLSKLG